MKHHIGLMGTHSAGKTHYAKKLIPQLSSANDLNPPHIISEVARQCPYSVNKNATESGQLWIFHMQLVKELEAILNYNFVICDRTVLDSLIYAEHAGLSDVVDACLPMALHWMDQYTQLLWFRPKHGILVPDGFRDTDPQFQKDIDLIFESFIIAFQIPVQEVHL